MPFARPTLSELRAATASDIAAALPGADALLRWSNLGILGDVLAALTNGQYGYLDWIARQAVPFTATDEYLEGWAGLKGVVRKPATPAGGTVTFTGTNGAVIPVGSSVFRTDGVEYATTDEATISDGAATVPVAAVAAGSVGNATLGVSMTLGVAIPGVNSTGAVASPLAGGAEVERDDDLRSRMLQVYAAPPQGGAAQDYLDWALEVPGVTRAWVFGSGMGPGTVVINFMMDDAEAVHGGFPQGADGVASAEARDTAATGDQLLVANALFTLQPVTVLVYVVAPQPNTINLTIAGLTGATTALRNAIAAAVRSALAINAAPGGVTNISAIEGAIANVNGSAGFVLTNVAVSHGSVSPGSAGNISSDAGFLPVLGTISYT